MASIKLSDDGPVLGQDVSVGMIRDGLKIMYGAVSWILALGSPSLWIEWNFGSGHDGVEDLRRWIRRLQHYARHGSEDSRSTGDAARRRRLSEIKRVGARVVKGEIH
jgi:hypothetical protein